MEHLYEKVAYLRGLAEGMELKESSKEGKVLLQIIETLEEFTDAIVELDENQLELTDYVETLDEDLEDVEDELYEEELDSLEIQCPECKEVLFIDDEDLLDDENIQCPECNEEVEIEESKEN
ncbi:CD1247 N-terminal domain-containing protein [Isachenkonia alkalipeptolytica]|uniref:Uncharacterized protein n=1 Tax=Isachenkonia alkalipeptolytica TaxID=2565777 RepID=A0AA43XLA3_9CLOT|nr:CD1247 N-terminal domain-containing protein [Isachenkonia alkalipeptolytica]NBG88787.1 hypothetical protein [Isachenkonia alkalipeptolytica]